MTRPAMLYANGYPQYDEQAVPIFHRRICTQRQDNASAEQITRAWGLGIINYDHTVYPRSEMFSRSSRYSEAQPEQAEAKRRSA